MKAAHSPGPWQAYCDPPRHPRRMALVATSNGPKAVDCTNSGASYAMDCYNARLIAAAPELLAALKAARAEVHGDCTEEGCSDFCRLLTAPIDKAELGA